VRINGHYTSISLEDDFWDALTQACRELSTTRQDFISQLALEFHGINLSSAVRIRILAHYQKKMELRL
jgi:predicted DNA-binding ribbon-helix-helix protein